MDLSYSENGGGGTGNSNGSNIYTIYLPFIPGSGDSGNGPVQDPGGVTGGPNPGTTPQPVSFVPVLLDYLQRRECEKINNHMNGIFNLREKLTYLATKVNEANESGFGMSQFGGTFEFLDNDSTGDIIFTSPPGVIYNVISHTHTEGKLSVFSFADLEAIAKFIRGGHINDEVNTIILTLSTQKGTHYVLTISDMTKFKEFFFYKVNVLGTLDIPNRDKYYASYAKADKLHKKYYLVENGRILPDAVDNEQTLIEFLKFINEANLGVSLFETDANFQDFSKLSLSFSGNSVKRNQCD